MKLQSPVERRVITSVGHTFSFNKNEPIEIPPLAVQDCLQAGCHVVEGAVLTEEEVEKVVVVQGPERVKIVSEAMKQLIARNGREDFTGSGKPALEAIEKIVSFYITAQERDAVWQDVTENLSTTTQTVSSSGAKKEDEAG